MAQSKYELVDEPTHHPSLFEWVWSEVDNENTESPYYLFPFSVQAIPVVRQQLTLSGGELGFAQNNIAYDNPKYGEDSGSVNLCGSVRYRQRDWSVHSSSESESSSDSGSSIDDFSFDPATGIKSITTTSTGTPVDFYYFKPVSPSVSRLDLSDDSSTTKGTLTLSDEITLDWLSMKQGLWRIALRRLWDESDPLTYDFGPSWYLTIDGASASCSENETGFSLQVADILVWKTTDIHLTVPHSGGVAQWDRKGYTKPFRMAWEHVKRINTPAAWSKNESGAYRSGSGMGCYTHGEVVATLEQPITTSKWRDEHGCFDADDTNALDVVGWSAGWVSMTDFVPCHNQGRAARGMVLSATGSTYRCSMESGYITYPGEVWHVRSSRVITVSASVPASVEFDSADAEEFGGGWTVRITKIEVQSGAEWLDVTAEDPLTQVGNMPAPGVLLLLLLKSRLGVRWGFCPGMPGDHMAFEEGWNIPFDGRVFYAVKRCRSRLEAKPEP